MCVKKRWNYFSTRFLFYIFPLNYRFQSRCSALSFWATLQASAADNRSLWSANRNKISRTHSSGKSSNFGLLFSVMLPPYCVVFYRSKVNNKQKGTQINWLMADKRKTHDVSWALIVLYCFFCNTSAERMLEAMAPMRSIVWTCLPQSWLEPRGWPHHESPRTMRRKSDSNLASTCTFWLLAWAKLKKKK